MKKFLKFGGAFLLFLILFYFAGPRPKKTVIYPKIESLKVDIKDIDVYVKNHEQNEKYLKKGNEAQIVWFDSLHHKTPYSLIYLHGFSASEQEGDPIARDFAKRYGCNLYLARLQSHGLINGESMKNLNVTNYVESAKKAISIGQIIGDSVIVMSTSTGGTLALYLAANNSSINSLICYSPNIRVKDPLASLLNNPWGKQIANAVIGGPTYSWDGDDSTLAYWTTAYPFEALITMQDLLELTMNNETFEKIKIPTFIGYYYKDEKNQDQVVSVPKILEMSEQLAVSEDKKVVKVFPNAGHHVIASRHKSSDLKGVKEATFDFAENILHLKVIE